MGVTVLTLPDSLEAPCRDSDSGYLHQPKKETQANYSALPTLQHDNLDGAFLADSTDEVVTLDDPALRCLDVHNCPHLKYLDISQCRADLHLTVRGCPSLSRIRLALEHQTGATVHIDFGEELHPLKVIGRISELDACWTDGRFATSRAANKVTLDNAYIGPWEDMAVFAKHELVVFQGKHRPDSTLHLAAEDVVRELIILDCPALETIKGGPHLEALTLENPKALKFISLSRGVGHLRVSHAPQLTDIQAQSCSVVLVDDTGAAKGLALEGDCRHLALTDSGIERLDAPGVTNLELISCSALRYVKLHPLASTSVVGATRAVGLGLERLRLDESAVRDLAWRSREGDAEACQLLLDWCAEADNRKAWLDALTVLDELADQGFDKDWLWALRCRMHARCNRSRGRNTNKRSDPLALARRVWHWDLPHDLAQRGWDADLRLWLACGSLPGAQGLERLLSRTNRPRHLATMARYLLKQSEAGDTEHTIYQSLCDALRQARPLANTRGPKNYLGKSKAEEESFLISDYLDPVLQCAVALRDRALAEALHHYANQCLEPRRRASILARLLKLGLIEARQSLMQLAPEARAVGDTHLAADVMGMALSPVEHALFDRGSPT